MPKTGVAKRNGAVARSGAAGGSAGTVVGPGQRLDDLLDAGRHLLGWPCPIDDFELALIVVVPDQGGGPVEEDVQAMVDDPLEVVAAMALAEALLDRLRLELQIEDSIQGPVERRQHAVE